MTAALQPLEFKFDPAQARDKDGKWTEAGVDAESDDHAVRTKLADLAITTGMAKEMMDGLEAGVSPAELLDSLKALHYEKVGKYEAKVDAEAAAKADFETGMGTVGRAEPTSTFDAPNGANPNAVYAAMVASGVEMPKAFKSEVAHVRELADEPVKSRVSEDVLLSILADGRFKTQHETGTSNGMLDPTRRDEREAQMFGVPMTRPFYGYVLHPNAEGERPTYQSSYGEVAVVFNDDVRMRTTITGGDSLTRAATAPLPVNEIAGASDERIRAAFTEGGGDFYGSSAFTYIEAQIHGPLTVADIDHVEFQRKPSPIMQGTLYRAGVSWSVPENRTDGGIVEDNHFGADPVELAFDPNQPRNEDGEWAEAGGNKSLHLLDDDVFLGSALEGLNGFPISVAVKHFGSIHAASKLTDAERATIHEQLSVTDENSNTSAFRQLDPGFGPGVQIIHEPGGTLGVAMQVNAAIQSADIRGDDLAIRDLVYQFTSSKITQDELSAKITDLTGVTVESSLISKVNGQWASSADSTVSSAMHSVVQEKFGLSGPGIDHMDLANRYEVPELLSQFGPALRAVADVTYRTTQESLAAKGVKTMQVYRGITVGPRDTAPDRIVADPHPLSSWSAAEDVAHDFAEDSGRLGLVYGSNVPVANVYSLANMTGTGSLSEYEVILIGRPTVATKIGEHDYRVKDEEFAVKNIPRIMIDNDDADWIKTVAASRYAVSAPLRASSGFDPNQPRNDEGEWENTTVGRLYGTGDLDKMFGGSPTTTTPWSRVSASKTMKNGFPAAVIADAIANLKYTTEALDPRTLRATQTGITRDGVNYYMGTAYDETGTTYADGHSQVNEFPTVYRKRNGQLAIVTGHHRFAAGLLQGKPVVARIIDEA